MVRNPSQVRDVFLPFVQLGYKIRKVKEYCSQQNIDLPKHADGSCMCLGYHIKGLCTTICGACSDHRVHTTEEDASMVTWCTANYKVGA
ncbi:MAG: hypothetical protein SGARI_000630 [Bacillariaceae sp.]